MPTPEHLIVAFATVAIVLLAVLLHYEASALLSRFVAATRMRQRPRMLVLILGLLLAHVAEIWLFGLGAWALLGVEGTGGLAGPQTVGLLDLVYVAATTYTTLGYGDFVPVGHLRFLFGMAALTGLVLVTWSASLTFLEMQRHWDQRPQAGRRSSLHAPRS